MKRLTPAQRRVLWELTKHDNKPAAARALGLSPHTVSRHLNAIYLALDVHSLHRAMIVAAETGQLP